MSNPEPTPTTVTADILADAADSLDGLTIIEAVLTAGVDPDGIRAVSDLCLGFLEDDVLGPAGIPGEYQRPIGRAVGTAFHLGIALGARAARLSSGEASA